MSVQKYPDFSSDEVYRFQERAAILEFEADYDRYTAERTACREIFGLRARVVGGELVKVELPQESVVDRQLTLIPVK